MVERVSQRASGPLHVETVQSASVLRALWKYPGGLSKAQLGQVTQLGRMTVDRRLHYLLERGIVQASGTGASRGGRAPVIWSAVPASGTLLVIAIGYRSTVVCLTDLMGRILVRQDLRLGVVHEAALVCRALVTLGSRLLGGYGDNRLPPVSGLSITIPAPVDFRTGRLRTLHLGDEVVGQWPDLDLGAIVGKALHLPVVVSDELVAQTTWEIRQPQSREVCMFVRMSYGLGLGVSMGGEVRHGAGGASGEFAHVHVFGDGGERCMCGRHGCLEAYASGWVLERRASQESIWRGSPVLSGLHGSGRVPTLETIALAAASGDPVCRQLMQSAVSRLSSALAVAATIVCPEEVVVGGEAAVAGDYVAELLQYGLNQRLLPSIADNLQVRPGASGRQGEIGGAAFIFVERSLESSSLAVWDGQFETD